MELRAGYKQTEVGVIPEDWDVQSLGTFGKFKGGNGFPLRYQGHVFGDYPFFKVSDMNNDGNALFMHNSNHWITEKARKELGATVHPSGSIVFAKIGAAIFLERKKILVRDSCIDNNVMAFVFNSSETDRRFFHYIFLTIELGKLVSATALPSLNGRDIAALTFGVPRSLDEQRAIAEALSDADALIASLDALIAKKRDFRQAAMQQLLTGKSRLPGFTSEWETKRLGDILKIRHGKSQKGVEASDGAFPILATGGEIGRTNVSLYDKPSVLIGRKGTIDAPQFVDTPFWTIDTLFFTEISAAAIPKFVFYRFLLIEWRSYNEASGVPSLSSATIEKIELECPEPDEQAAIVEVLADIDTELSALERRRDKARAIKQGMMQELLTGRIRLV